MGIVALTVDMSILSGALRVAIMKEAGKLVNQSEMAMDRICKLIYACDQIIRN